MINKLASRFNIKSFFSLAAFLALFFGLVVGDGFCNQQKSKKKTSLSKQFYDYWNRGKAEISRYALSQSRYGEIRKGYAVMIFVTEPFLRGKQVKYEGYASGADSIETVLKLNAIRKFSTGIYPYSMMLSTFTPLIVQQAAWCIKITASVQEWCGHVFQQLNLRKNGYQARLYSYFQKEGDQNFLVGRYPTEDAIWSMIRIAPASLPIGPLMMIPGLYNNRFSHRPLRVARAIAKKIQLKQLWRGRGLSRYSLEYPDLCRKIEFTYTKSFPYRIVAWQEYCEPGKSKNKKSLITKASLTHFRMSAYWKENKNRHLRLRKQLGLQ